MTLRTQSIVGALALFLVLQAPARADYINLDVLADHINDVCDKNSDGWVNGYDWVLMNKTEKYENTAKIVSFIIAMHMENGGAPIELDDEWNKIFYVMTKMVQPKIENHFVKKANRKDTIASVAQKYVSQEGKTLNRLIGN